MNPLRFLILTAVFPALLAIKAGAAASADVRFSNEAADTTRINNILMEAIGQDFRSSGECIEWLGRKFMDTPYVGGTLECDGEEKLTVNLDGLDCTTFVETVVAMAYTIGERRSSWRDFVYNLERIRYRGGNMDGYPSRLHYISDWIVDNTHRGNIAEATGNIPHADHMVKTLDFMTEHRNLYPALGDSATFERLKSVQIGYRSHRFPYIKTQNVGKKDTNAAMKSGDIVALTTKTPGLDISHMGIIVKQDGVPYMLHASSSGKKVEITPYPISEYLHKNRNLTGIRIIRLKDW